MKRLNTGFSPSRATASARDTGRSAEKSCSDLSSPFPVLTLRFTVLTLASCLSGTLICAAMLLPPSMVPAVVLPYGQNFEVLGVHAPTDLACVMHFVTPWNHDA